MKFKLKNPELLWIRCGTLRLDMKMSELIKL